MCGYAGGGEVVERPVASFVISTGELDGTSKVRMQADRGGQDGTMGAAELHKPEPKLLCKCGEGLLQVETRVHAQRVRALKANHGRVQAGMHSDTVSKPAALAPPFAVCPHDSLPQFAGKVRRR